MKSVQVIYSGRQGGWSKDQGPTALEQGCMPVCDTLETPSLYLRSQNAA